MGLKETLDELAERRLSFRAFREQVDAEVRQLRLDKLSAEQSNIEHLIVKAAAEGATTGQIKRSYGTKDHRTVANILTRRAAEIEAIRNAAEEKRRGPDWFTISDGVAVVTIGDHSAGFSWTEVDGELMFTTDAPLWDDDYTVRNEAVTLLDGKIESDSEEAAILARAIREAS